MTARTIAKNPNSTRNIPWRFFKTALTNVKRMKIAATIKKMPNTFVRNENIEIGVKITTKKKIDAIIKRMKYRGFECSALKRVLKRTMVIEVKDITTKRVRKLKGKERREYRHKPYLIIG